MSEFDPKMQALLQAGKIEKAKGPTNRGPSDDLMGFHLNGSLRTSHLGLELLSKVQKGSADLYSRLKVRDPVDSLYAGTIVALNNAVMQAYSEAAQSNQNHDQNLARAFEGTALFIDLMTAFETRRDVRKRNDPDLRANVVEAALKRLDLKKGK